MDMDRIEALLERIAVALERIAGRDERMPAAVSGNDLAAALQVEEVPAPRQEELRDALRDKGITVLAHGQDAPEDRVLDSLAEALGRDYGAMELFLKRIKVSLNNGHPVELNLAKTEQRDISTICNFAKRMHDQGLLTSYHYQRAPACQLRVQPNREGRFQSWFSGQWLERFIWVETRQALAAAGLNAGDWEVMRNAQIELANDNRFELDLVLLVKGQLVHVEAKSGDYQQHLARYGEFGRLLGVSRERQILVLAKIPEERCQDLSDLHRLTVRSLRGYRQAIRKAIETPQVMRAAG